MLGDLEYVANLLDLTPSKVRELTASGAMPQPIDIAGEERWRVDELRNWVAMRCPRLNGVEHMVGSASGVECLVPQTIGHIDHA